MSTIPRRVQIDNICRTCLSEEPNMKSLFEIDCNSGGVLQLCQMLMACTFVRVQEDDGLPAQICLSCINSIARSFSFKKLCEDSDATLREALRKSTNAQSLIELNPSKSFALSSQEALADNQDLMLNAKMEFEEADTNIGDLISHTEYTDCAKDEIKMMINTDNVNTETVESYADFEDTKPDIRVDPIHDQQELLLEPSYSCEQCKACFTLESDLKIHSDTHQKSVTHKSKVRSKKSTNSKSLRTNTKVPTKFICSECGKSFVSRSAFHCHKKSHTDLQSLICTVCDKRLCDSRSLALHMKVHTGLRTNICSYCGKGFTFRNYLIIHERTHTGEKPFICTVCNKGFADPSGLTVHFRSHSGERPYVCEVCDKGFVTSSKLKKHMRIHTGEKPFRCHLCSTTFRRSETLQIHIKQHTGEQNYVCVHCKKGFYNASTLKIHLRIHTGERPYTCKICSKSYKQSGALATHLKTH